VCIRRQCINDQSQGEPWVQVPGLFCHLQTNFPYSCSRHPFLVVRGALSPNLESNPVSATLLEQCRLQICNHAWHDGCSPDTLYLPVIDSMLAVRKLWLVI